MEKLNQQIKKVSLGNCSSCIYADAVVRFLFSKNPQKIFDRQMKCVKLFSVLKVTKDEQ